MSMRHVLVLLFASLCVLCAAEDPLMAAVAGGVAIQERVADLLSATVDAWGPLHSSNVFQSEQIPTPASIGGLSSINSASTTSLRSSNQLQSTADVCNFGKLITASRLQYSCNQSVVSAAQYQNIMSTLLSWSNASSVGLPSPNCSLVMSRWVVMRQLASSQDLCAPNATLLSAATATALSRNASADLSAITAAVNAALGAGVTSFNNQPVSLTQWCTWATNSSACDSCTRSTEQRDICACPFDFTGESCQTPVPLMCWSNLTSPAASSPTCGSTFHPGHDPKYLGAGAPCYFTPTLKAALQISASYRCTFANAVREGPSNVAALAGFTWNTSYNFTYAHGVPGGFVRSRAVSSIPTRLKVFNLDRFSDQSNVATASIGFSQLSGASDLSVTFPSGSFQTAAHAPGGRLYFELSIDANSAARLDGFPAATVTQNQQIVVLRQHIEVSDWSGGRYRSKSWKWPTFLIVILVLACVGVVAFFIYRWYTKRVGEQLNRAALSRQSRAEGEAMLFPPGPPSM